MYIRTNLNIYTMCSIHRSVCTCICICINICIYIYYAVAELQRYIFGVWSLCAKKSGRLLQRRALLIKKLSLSIRQFFCICLYYVYLYICISTYTHKYTRKPTQSSSKNAMMEQAERVSAANDAAKLSLDDMELLAAEQREEEVARVRACTSEVSSKSAQTTEVCIQKCMYACRNL